MIYWLVLILTPVYIVWCFKSAYKARESVAEKLDAILANEEINSTLRYVLVSMYQDCFKQTVAIKFVLVSLFSSNKRKLNSGVNADNSPFVEELTTLSEEEKENYLSVMLGLIMVNVRYAPLTYFFIGVIVGLVVLFRVVFFGSSQSLLQFIKDKFRVAESRYAEHVTN